MSTPFNTSLRRDPDDPRGLGERIEALIRERIEEAVEFIAMDLLVQLRRAHGRPAPEAGSPGDRAEFQELVQDLLRHLRRECSEGLAPDALGKVSQAEDAQGREELARLLAGQTALARLLPDYWQRFEVSKGDFARARLTAPPPRVRIRDLVRYYLRLGTLGFGGPVALCGQMEKELVQERKWLTKDEMREGIAVCQSLPGPLAIQVGIFISYLRGGFWGAWAGGWAFIFPNFVIVTALGALYVHFGGLSLVTAIFYGVSPAVIALILHSCYRLAKLGMEDWLQWAIAAVCFTVTVGVQAEVALLFILSGLAGIVYYGSLFRAKPGPSAPLLAAVPLAAGAATGTSGPILGKLFLFFLKAGSLTFGSGLVIVPFLEKGLVQQTGWLDERQFLIAVAMGMLSPGPVVITATFVGYLVAGFWGSVVATVGIFLPSFLLVLVVAPVLVRHRANPNVQGFVKGAYAAAIGTILGASVLLGKIAIGDWLTVLVALGSLVVLFRWKVSNPALVAATAIIGLLAFPLLRPTWIFVK